jgi:hypothetical protein
MKTTLPARNILDTGSLGNNIMKKPDRLNDREWKKVKEVATAMWQGVVEGMPMEFALYEIDIINREGLKEYKKDFKDAMKALEKGEDLEDV